MLNRTLIWNQAHLLHALREYEHHHNEHQPHRCVANARPLRASGVAAAAFGARIALLVLAGVLLASVVILPWKAWRTAPDGQTGTRPDSPAVKGL